MLERILNTNPSIGQGDAALHAEYRLPDVLDLASASGLRDELRKLLKAGARGIDAQNVQRLSTPCVQVMLAAGLEAERLGQRLKICRPSDAFLSAIHDLGLTRQFESWMQR